MRPSRKKESLKELLRINASRIDGELRKASCQYRNRASSLEQNKQSSKVATLKEAYSGGPHRRNVPARQLLIEAELVILQGLHHKIRARKVLTKVFEHYAAFIRLEFAARACPYICIALMLTLLLGPQFLGEHHDAQCT